MSHTYSAIELSNDLADLAQRLRPSVVRVQAGHRGIGSGVIWSVATPDATGGAEATVVTNAHVVGVARTGTLTVRLADTRELPATIMAVDPAHDLAALRLHTTGLHPAAIGDSATLRVGELVIAVGNPWGHEGAVTAGVVAARAPADPDLAIEPAETDRPAAQPEVEPPGSGSRRGPRWRVPQMDVIQADIHLYPGNSGGLLADARGRVVGINAMVGGGLAFAIPSRTVQQFLAQTGHLTARAYLGVQVLTVPLAPILRQRLHITQATAVLVTAIEPGGPADAAGILVGDVLLAIDGQPIHDARQLPPALNRADIGQPRTLALLRGGQRFALTLTPAARAA